MKFSKKKHYLLYSLIFVVFASFIVFEYYSKGKSLINYGGDGYRQHFRGLAYVSLWLKQIISNIFTKGIFEIPQWGFSIAEGSDIINTFHYYGLGDPINLLSVFVNEEYLYLFYDLSILLRMYLAGIFFSKLCFFENKNTYGVLAGALIYSFSSFSILSAIGHIYFLNGVMYFPLVILGIEKIVNKKSGILLTVSVALLSLSSIYFFYMIVIATIVFALIRVTYLNITIKEKIAMLLKMFGFSFIGLMISAVIFLPEAYSMLSNSRLSYTIENNLFYSIPEYINKLSVFVYGENYFGGYSILALFALLSLFITKSSKTIKTLSVVCLLLIIFPYFGKVFNAFTYVTDRWLFIISLFISYLVTDKFEDILCELRNRKYIYVLMLVVYFVVLVLMKNIDTKIYLLIFVYGMFVIIFVNICKNNTLRELAIVSICVVNIALIIFFKFSTNYWNYGIRGTDIDLAKNICSGEYDTLPFSSNDFFRYSGDSLVTNASITGPISSTGYYWSVANNNVIEFRTAVGLSDKNNHHYDSYDDSYILNSLASVKYYIKKDNDLIPYDYSKVSSTDEFDVYENNEVLPIIYGYDELINEEEWNELSVIDKQIALTKNAVIDCGEALNNSTNIYEILNYDINYGKGINLIENGFEIVESNSAITLNINGDEVGEYYLVVDNFDFNNSSYIDVNLYNGTSKQLIFKEKGTPEYCGKHNFAINLGYLNGVNGNIEIVFPDLGTVTYDDINVICLPLEEAKANIKKLNCININNYEQKTNGFNLDVKLDKDKYACVSVPYCEGWKVYIDGKEVEIQRTNIMYMGFPLEKGQHYIEFKYSTPLLLEGSIVSVAGLVALCFVIINGKKRKKN